MSDIECPYCGEEQEINHDDGYGYEEDRTHEQGCADCGKTFAYTTSIHYHYNAAKADCLNGAPHNFKAAAHPWFPERKRCMDCDHVENGPMVHKSA